MAAKAFPKTPIVIAFSRLLVEHVFRLDEGNPIDIDRFIDRHEAHKSRLARERQERDDSREKEGLPPPPPPEVAAKQLQEKRGASRKSRFAGIGITF